MVRRHPKRGSAPPPPPVRHSVLTASADDASTPPYDAQTTPPQQQQQSPLSDNKPEETSESLANAIKQDNAAKKLPNADTCTVVPEHTLTPESSSAPCSSPPPAVSTSLLKIVKKNITSHKPIANRQHDDVITSNHKDHADHADGPVAQAAANSTNHDSSHTTAPDKSHMCHQCQHAIDPSSIRIKEGVGRKLVDKMRHSTQLTYARSQQAVELLLRSLASEVVPLATIMDQLLLSVHYQVTPACFTSSLWCATGAQCPRTLLCSRTLSFTDCVRI